MCEIGIELYICGGGPFLKLTWADLRFFFASLALWVAFIKINGVRLVA
jgi:hypothetical protein